MVKTWSADHEVVGTIAAVQLAGGSTPRSVFVVDLSCEPEDVTGHHILATANEEGHAWSTARSVDWDKHRPRAHGNRPKAPALYELSQQAEGETND